MSKSIQNLNQGTPSGAAQVPYYDPAQGQDRRCSVDEILALADTAPGGFVTQYAAPSTNGYTITVAPPTAGQSVWLLNTPNAGYALATIHLPTGVDGQEVLVSSTQAVTGTLTVTATTGQSVNGAPTTLAANGFFRMRFDGVLSAWYRIG